MDQSKAETSVSTNLTEQQLRIMSLNYAITVISGPNGDPDLFTTFARETFQFLTIQDPVIDLPQTTCMDNVVHDVNFVTGKRVTTTYPELGLMDE